MTDPNMVELAGVRGDLWQCDRGRQIGHEERSRKPSTKALGVTGRQSQ